MAALLAPPGLCEADHGPDSNLSRVLSPAGEEMLKHLEDYLEEGNSLKILVAGKMGVGKSSLINSIYGAELTAEGADAEAVTGEIVNFTSHIPTPVGTESKDSTITVWDSPGFGDIFAVNKEKMIQELCWVVDKVHILLYCFDIRQRFSNDDAQGLIEITKRVHPDIWRNAVFVLTFANEVKPSPDSKEDPVDVFGKKFLSWQKQITRALRQLAGVPEEIVRNISIVASGYRTRQPPGFRNWYTSLWGAIFEKTRDDGQPLLLKLTCNRLVDNGPDNIPDLSEMEISPHTSPGVLSTSPYALKVNLFGDRDHPGVVTMTPAVDPRRTHATSSPVPMVPTKQSGAQPPPAGAFGYKQLPHAQGPKGPSTNRQSPGANEHSGANGYSGVNGTAQSSANGRLQSSASVQIPAIDDVPRGPVVPGPPPAGEPQPPAQPPADDANNDQPQDDHPKPRRGRAFLKGAGTLAGATATGALVGALVGIVGGPFGVGVGAAMGTVVGGSIGVIGLIAMKLQKYIAKKKNKGQAVVQPEPV